MYDQTKINKKNTSNYEHYDISNHAYAPPDQTIIRQKDAENTAVPNKYLSRVPREPRTPLTAILPYVGYVNPHPDHQHDILIPLQGSFRSFIIYSYTH